MFVVPDAVHMHDAVIYTCIHINTSGLEPSAWNQCSDALMGSFSYDDDDIREYLSGFISDVYY